MVKHFFTKEDLEQIYSFWIKSKDNYSAYSNYAQGGRDFMKYLSNFYKSYQEMKEQSKSEKSLDKVV